MRQSSSRRIRGSYRFRLAGHERAAGESAFLGPRDPSSAGNAAEHDRPLAGRIIELQQTGAESPEFYGKTARALVDLVDMDLGLVLLRREASWKIAGSAAVSSKISVAIAKRS